MAKNDWTYEEHVVAFNLYCKIPFTKINATYKPVIELAKLIGRSNGSVAMKLANFARLDPAQRARNVSGLTRGAKGEEKVWNEFNNNWEELGWKSEQILARYKSESIESSAEVYIDDLPLGIDRETIVRLRVNQAFFRKTILASFNYKCCITGINSTELLIASHIKPWAADKENRLNPTNGLCLNALFDKAFDSGLLTITPDYTVKISDTLNLEKENNLFFSKYNKSKIFLPQKFLPNKEFLEYHNSKVFKK
ncbi:HNH endonuclease [Flavobacterium rhizosphaerae]|uniref:HNH endonuclease n=1 Tax=Flavobacterium rhizosphaerae TaxID=3163298 RepID=A0ABW8YYD4_9FLAO